MVKEGKEVMEEEKVRRKDVEERKVVVVLKEAE